MANENEYTDRTVELTDRHNEKSEVAFFSNAGGHDVLVSYNYMLRVEGMYDLPCKAVHSFTKENKFDYVQEGGLNDYVHLLRKPITKPFTFTVERYVGTDLMPILPLGAELVLPVILMVSPFPNDFGKSKRTFVFTGCTVMSKTFGELNAEKSGLLTETIVIGYREMTEVTIPVHAGSDGPVWEFDGRKVEGNKQQQAIRTIESIDDVPELRQWAFDKNNFKGIGTQSAQKPLADDVSATDLVADRKWKFDGTGVQSAQKHMEIDLPKKTAADEAEGGETDEIVAAPERKWAFDKENKKNSKGTGIQSAHKFEDADISAEDKVTDRKWGFDKDNYKGTGTQSAQKFADADISAEDKVANRKWKFDGTGTQSALPLTEVDLPKKTESDEAENGESGEITAPAERKWAFDKDNYKGKGRQSAQKFDDADISGTDGIADRKWKFDGTVEGQGKQSAQKPSGTDLPKENEDSNTSGKWTISNPKENTNAKTEAGSKAEGRRWSIDGKMEKLPVLRHKRIRKRQNANGVWMAVTERHPVPEQRRIRKRQNASGV